MDYNFVEVSEATLRDVHLPAFKACLDAGALTLMSAFNDIAGVPASGNRPTETVVGDAVERAAGESDGPAGFGFCLSFCPPILKYVSRFEL